MFLFNFLWIYWVFNHLIGSENLRCADVNWDRLVVCGGGFGPFGAMVFVSGLLGWMGCVRAWGFALLGLRVGRRRRCGFQRHQVSGREAAVPPLCVIRWEYSRFAFCVLRFPRQNKTARRLFQQLQDNGNLNSTACFCFGFLVSYYWPNDP